MNILFLTTNKINNINDKGIYPDILREFIRNNHDLTVVSAVEKRENKETSLTKQKNYTHLEVKTGNLIKVGIVEKVISLSRINRLYKKAIKKHLNISNFDLIIYNTPPIMLNNTIAYIKRNSSSKAILLLKDIFPQNAVDLRMFSKKGLIYKYYRRKEKKLYKISDKIGCMSQGNIDYVLNENKYLKSDKLFLAPNSIEISTRNIKLSKINDIKKKYNIPKDKNIFIYGGNLGKPQGIDFLLRVVKANEENNRNYILIIGSGTEYNKIKTYFDENKPKNSKLMKFLPKEEYEKLISISSVGLILLDYRFTIPNIPSRLLSYLELSKPVLAATDKNTDLKEIIEDGEFGYWCESKDEFQFLDLMSKFTEENIEIMGANGRKHLEKHYDVVDLYQNIMLNYNELNEK